MTRKICESYIPHGFNVIIHKLNLDPRNEVPGVLKSYGLPERLEEVINPIHGFVTIYHALGTSSLAVVWKEFDEGAEVDFYWHSGAAFSNKFDFLCALQDKSEHTLISYFMSLLEI